MRAGGAPADRDEARVAAVLADVGVHPAQRGPDVVDHRGPPRVRAEPVVDADADPAVPDEVAHQRVGVVLLAARRPGPAVDLDEDRGAGVGREVRVAPDVEEVLAAVRAVGDVPRPRGAEPARRREGAREARGAQRRVTAPAGRRLGDGGVRTEGRREGLGQDPVGGPGAAVQRHHGADGRGGESQPHPAGAGPRRPASGRAGARRPRSSRPWAGAARCPGRRAARPRRPRASGGSAAGTRRWRRGRRPHPSSGPRASGPTVLGPTPADSPHPGPPDPPSSARPPPPRSPSGGP